MLALNNWTAVLACMSAVKASLGSEKTFLKFGNDMNFNSGSIVSENERLGVDVFKHAVINYVDERDTNKRSEDSYDYSVASKPLVDGQIQVGDKMSEYLSKIEDYDLSPEVNKIEGYILSAEIDKRTMKQDTMIGSFDCTSKNFFSKIYLQFICKSGKLAWQKFYHGELRVWLNQKYLAAIWIGNRYTRALVSFGPNIEALAGKVKSFSNNTCGGSLYKSEGWEIAISTFSNHRGCETIADIDNIKDTLGLCVKAAEDQSAVAYCCRMDHMGNWFADVRLQRGDIVHSNIWDIACWY